MSPFRKRPRPPQSRAEPGRARSRNISPGRPKAIRTGRPIAVSKPLEAEDAGIFFGREAPTVAALDRLRGLREAAPPRFLAILAASGAGKSSFLRAGILPRLARDDRHFLTLPVVRPERAALGGEIGLLARARLAFANARLAVTRAQIHAAIDNGAAALSPLLARLARSRRARRAGRAARRRRRPSCSPSIRARNCSWRRAPAEARAFLALLKDIVNATTPAVIVMVAIRSDAYERLHRRRNWRACVRRLSACRRCRTVPIESVIEGPARRLSQSRRPSDDRAGADAGAARRYRNRRREGRAAAARLHAGAALCRPRRRRRSDAAEYRRRRRERFDRGRRGARHGRGELRSRSAARQDRAARLVAPGADSLARGHRSGNRRAAPSHREDGGNPGRGAPAHRASRRRPPAGDGRRRERRGDDRAGA